MASLTDVADRAGYTIGAVYSNFSSKDGLFLAVMRDRLPRIEAMLAGALAADGQSALGPAASVDERITQELDRLAAGEDSVPSTWWRLLSEFRIHAAADPKTWAELAESERRCREIIARHIARFAVDIGIVLPVSAIELAELTSALSDGLRAPAEGRSMTSCGPEAGRCGLDRDVAAVAKPDPAPDATSSTDRRHQVGGTPIGPGAPRKNAGAPDAESDRCRARRAFERRAGSPPTRLLVCRACPTT
jgi:AcrR family transcriptional regulator